MEQFLTAYTNRMRPLFNGIPATTAHEIASAFLAFKFGLYPNAIHECTQAISLIPDSGVNAVLNAAALTYVAGLITAVLQLLYYASLVGGGRRR